MTTITVSTALSTFDQLESAARSYCRGFRHVLTSAAGSIVRDSTGREYIDFLANAGALNYGHNDPDLKAALIDYLLEDGITASLDLHTNVKADFLATFDQLILAPRGLDYRVQFTGPTGTNAVEAALKLARKVTGRTNVIAFTNAFHGVTAGSLAATASSHHRMGPEQGLHGITRMPYEGFMGAGFDTSEYLHRMLHDPSSGIDRPAAIILETVQGEGGLNVASTPWLQRIAGIAREHGALLIIDDVQAGCGRTGSFFSFEGQGVTPDLVVLSKSLSGFGLPMALLLMRPDIDLWSPGEHNGTFRGNNHAFVTATAALRKFWSDAAFTADVARRSGMVRRSLAEIAEVTPAAHVKGRGMMQGIDMGDSARAASIRQRCVERGLLIECSGSWDEVVKVMAPLTTPDDLLEAGLTILAGAVADEYRQLV